MDHKPALTVEAVAKCYEAHNKKVRFLMTLYFG